MPKKKSKAALLKKAKMQKKNKNRQRQQAAAAAAQAAAAPPPPPVDKFQLEVDQKLPYLADPDAFVKEYERDLHISNFELNPIGGGPPLIQHADLRFVHNHKYGLIGYNGAGKTTLLKHIAEYQCPEIPRYIRIKLVSQEMEGTSQSVLQTVLGADEERDLLMQEEERIRGLMEEKEVDLVERLEIVHERLKSIEADTAEARASAVLDGLQFTDRMKNMMTSDLSGGWRMRVSLACALFVEPDLLLLDEPTNHLDVPSVMFLTEYLQVYNPEKIVVIVSHDRRFLNEVCTDIMHLTQRRHIIYYRGNYEAFERIRAERRMHQSKQYERQQNTVRHNERFIERFKANKKWSTQAQSRQKMLSKMKKVQKVVSDLQFHFEFPSPPPLKNPRMLTMDEVDFGYFGHDDSGESYLLHDVTLRLEMGTKVGIIGANGAGKSTLLKLIMEDLRPIQGTCALTNAVQTGFFAQHHIETLDYNATPLEHLKTVFGDATIPQIYSQLGRFRLGRDFARQNIGTLSGGQKSRVAFSILTWYAPHLIIMDEPTNHLDIPSIDALTVALSEFEGSVILVSHDQDFLETVCDEFWAVGNRGVRIFDRFEACRRYTFDSCRPIDVLPREFSTVEVKKHVFGSTMDTERAIAEAPVAGAGVSAVAGSDVFVVDAERAIDRGLAKGLTPDAILKHVRGWSCPDGDRRVVDKLGFIMFHDYFDPSYCENSPLEFFQKWRSLICFCIPASHVVNQSSLIDIGHACFVIGLKDANARATQTYGFGIIVETMYNLGMVSQDSVASWVDEHEEAANAAESIEQLRPWLNDLDEESDSD